MKKILTVIIFTLAVSFQTFAADEKQYDNPGYMRSIGFGGVYGFLADYSKSGFEDNGIGGGAFIYFTPVNTIYGNMIIGVGSSFNTTGLTTNKGMGGKTIGVKYSNVPVQLNIGYSTSSDFVNVWGGVGFTYNYIDLYYRSIKTDAGEGIGLDSHDYKHLAGIDAFVGGEYLLTKNKLLGLFAEVRYSFIEDIIIDKKFEDTPQFNVHGKAQPWVLKIAIGLNVHF